MISSAFQGINFSQGRMETRINPRVAKIRYRNRAGVLGGPSLMD
jgi:hypothetical protein